MRRAFSNSLCAMAFMGALLLPVDVQATARQAPDNTATNKTATNSNTPTADQGKNGMSDVQLASHIRRDVVKDKSLSTYGHNVKIVAKHGKVTLNGPVHTDDEKKAIEAYATKYAGDGNVTDNLTVKADGK